jgi:predicted kinase
MRTPSDRLQLVVVSGPPCAGKTAVAAALHQALGGVRLDVDEIRLALLPASNQSRGDRDIAYRAMHLTTRLLLDARVSPLFVTATYTRHEPRRHLAEVVSEHAVDVFVVQCRVDGVIAVERFSRRPPGHAAVDLTADAVVNASATYPFTHSALVVDTNRPIADVVSEVNELLSVGVPTSLPDWRDAAELA